MNEIFLDIETVPSKDQWVQEYVKSTVSPPGNIKKQESIDKWWQEKSSEALQEKLEKCALDGAMNQVVAISFETENHTYTQSHDNEYVLLKDVFDYIETISETVSTYVGHNIAAFDLEVLKKRAIILNLRVPTSLRLAFKAKPWDSIIFDTMLKWDAKKPAKLDKICRALNIEFDSSVTGAHVWQLYKSGDFEAIANYCKDDVRKVKEVYKRMEPIC